MLSTIVGILQGPETPYGTANKVAALADLLLVVTALALPIIFEALYIPSGGLGVSVGLLTIGTVGLVLLAAKHMKSVNTTVKFTGLPDKTA